MEGIHGVDTSWLHHARGPRAPPSNHHHHHQQQPPTPPEDEPISKLQPEQEPPLNSPSTKALPDSSNPSNSASTPANGHVPQHESTQQTSGGGLFRRKSSERLSSEQVSPQAKAGKESSKTPPQTPSLSRRPSWMTSLTSKFGGSSQSSPASQNNTNAVGKNHQQTPPQTASQTSASPIEAAPISASPKSAGSGFLSSALRRFSTSNGAQMAKTVPNGGICPRKVLNVDQHRERCRIPDLQPAKLRRVAFCVDVEIAAPPKYKEEEPEEPRAITPGFPGRKRAGSASERDKKNKAKSKERSEGEALKNPTAMAQKKEKVNQGQQNGLVADKVEVPDIDDTSTKRQGAKASPPQIELALPVNIPLQSPMTATETKTPVSKSPGNKTSLSPPIHHDFGPQGMFEVDDWDDEPAPTKSNVTQRRGSTGGAVHHDFGRNGMFEIPSSSEDEGSRPENSPRSNSDSAVLSTPKKIAKQIGKVPVGHVFSEKLMFEIPELNDSQTRIQVVQEIQKLPDPAPEPQQLVQSKAEPAVSKDLVVGGSNDQVVEAQPADEHNATDTAAQTSRKKEKKKRSEEERKERKERKRQASIANGTIPFEITGDDTAVASNKPQKPQNRPTTDPLRIYRRCCQLRETHPLKRVVEQLSAPNACDPLNPAIVLALDLSNQTLQLQDIVTFGDWLAVVPVQRLMLENCGMNDEAVRVVLAGLLAAKTGEQAKHNKHLAKKPNKAKKQRLGVISKLSLKNNKMIGRNGWMHIGLFLNMSKSLKAIDLSGVTFPKPPPTPPKTSSTAEESSGSRASSLESLRPDPMDPFWKCMAERIADDELEEVVMGDCNLPPEQVEKLVDAVIACRVSRLGLAHNNLETRAFHAVARYIKSNTCMGLDLGGNTFAQPDDLKIILDAIDHSTNRMYALSMADCSLTASDLRAILPVLARLPAFRFVDFSHNHALFNTSPNAIGPLTKWLPQMKFLKRIGLNDVAMRSEHAISLAEILPEIPVFAHLSIMENPALTALANAKDEVAQEEACALYASLMAATRVSKTIVCIDIDVPSKENSEVVKALAKQVVAYSLHNMERNEYYQAAANIIAEPHGGEEAVAVPDVLLHLVGHVDRLDDDQADDTKVPDQDYLVGGTGVVKALSIVLGQKGRDSRRMSREVTPVTSGSSTPKLKADAKGKARDMSKNLLESARKIRHRLQPALVRAGADAPEEENTKRLGYLDATLERMIQRFEEEYPECRQVGRPRVDTSASAVSVPSGSLGTSFSDPFSTTHEAISTPADSSPPDEEAIGSLRRASRHGSDVSLASRQLVDEEGRLHRFGQRMRREIMPPTYTVDHHWGTTGDGVEPAHVEQLRNHLEGISSDQFRAELEEKGIEKMVEELKITAEGLKALQKTDPDTWKKCEAAGMCVKMEGGQSAVVNETDFAGEEAGANNVELRNGLTRPA